MNPKYLLDKSLPKELINIPPGQVFILTNPNVGITSKNIFMMQFIFSMARQYDKKHIVKEKPVDISGLWNCCICKINGDLLLIADKDSLVELLCKLWGLNYEDVCKTIIIPFRNKDITCGGDSHPIELQLKPSKKTESIVMSGDNSLTLNCIVNTSRERIMDIFQGGFQEMLSHNIDIPMEDIIALYDKVKNTRKTYRLDIHVERDVDAKGRPAEKVKCCEISLVDNTGVRYPLKMETMWVSLYLTYILFKDGKAVMDIGDSDFYDIFHKIQAQLPRGYKKFTPDGLIENAKFNLSKIRKAILNATNDIYAKEQFAIDGYSGDVYTVAGATDDDRTLIKEAFGLE